MYQSLLWYEDPCTCSVCVRMRTSFEAAYEVVKEAKKNKDSYQAILNAAAAVGDAAEKLHCEHKPELYLDMGGLALTNDTIEKQQQTQSPPRSVTSANEASKFIVVSTQVG